MDPNEALRRIRAQAKRASEASTNETAAIIAEEALEAFADLDEWLSRGGFLPSSWSDYPQPIGTMWAAPVVDSALDVEVDGTLNILLVMPAGKGKRRRQVTLSDVDRLHAQLEDARSFVFGQENPQQRETREQRIANALDEDF